MSNITVNGVEYQPLNKSEDILSYKDLMQRFNQRVSKTKECWLWTGSKTNEYGRIEIQKKRMLAHRLSYLIHKGSIGKNIVNHICCNKLCVNPDHLEAVSQKRNKIHYENNRYK